MGLRISTPHFHKILDQVEHIPIRMENTLALVRALMNSMNSAWNGFNIWRYMRGEIINFFLRTQVIPDLDDIQIIACFVEKMTHQGLTKIGDLAQQRFGKIRDIAMFNKNLSMPCMAKARSNGKSSQGVPNIAY
jgi:hypothetical protein